MMRKSNAASSDRLTVKSKLGWIVATLAIAASLFIGVTQYSNDSTAQGKIIYVNHLADGAADGASWKDAFRNPQKAFTAADSGDQVWIAKGTYNAVADAPFTIANGVRVYGGFAGTEQVLVDRDVALNPTVLAGEGDVVVLGEAGALLDGVLVEGEVVGDLAYAPPANASHLFDVTLIYAAGGLPDVDPRIISDADEEVRVEILATAVNSGALDGDSFLVASNGSPTDTIRVWLDVDDDGTPSPVAVAERGIEITSVVDGDTPEIVAAKLARRLDQDSALSAEVDSVNPALVIISTRDPFQAVSDNTVTANIAVATTDSTPTEINPAVFNTQYPFVEDSVLTITIGDTANAAAERLVGWRVEGGELLSTESTFDYIVTKNVTLEAVYVAPSAGFLPIIYVDADATLGANDGSSWADAYLALEDALDREELQDSPLDEIWIAEGTYAAVYTRPYVLSNQQRIYGGFDATEINRSERDFATNVDGHYLPVNETILQQAPFSHVFPPADLPSAAWHIITASDDVVLDGVVIEGGFADGGGFPKNRGGGILCTAGSPSIVNCIIRHNYASKYGGGLYALLGSPTVTNCVFIDNMAHRGGASFSDSLSFLTFTDSTFRANIASDSLGGFYGTESGIPQAAAPGVPPGPGWGGAIFNQGAALTIQSCNFVNNYMNMCGDGGAIYNNSTDVNGNQVQITDCLFVANKALMHVLYFINPAAIYGNIASFNHGYGGAIYNRASSPVITNCQFGSYVEGSWNSSTRNGGAVCNADQSRPTYKNCAFVNNRAFLRGGAVYNLDATTGGLFSNCIFEANEAPYGGAVYNDGAQTQFVDSVFQDNICYESQLLAWPRSDFVAGFLGSYAPVQTLTASQQFFWYNVPDYFAGWSASQGSGIMPIITEPLPDWAGVTGTPGDPVQTLPDVIGYFGGTAAAVFNDDGSPTFTACTFTGHTAINGAAIYNGRSLISLDPAIEVEADEDTLGPTETAGGIVNIINCDLRDNQSVESGGGIYVAKNYEVNLSGTSFGAQGDSSQGNHAGAEDDPSLPIIQDPSVVPLRDVFSYGGGWSQLPPLPVGRKKGRVVRVKEGDEDWLYFIGGIGWNRDTYTDFMSNYVWKLNLKKQDDGWIIVEPLNTAVHSFAACYDGTGRIYVFGGYTSTDQSSPTDVVQILDLVGNGAGIEAPWTTDTMPYGVRTLHGAALVETKDADGVDWARIHLLGGTEADVWTFWVAVGTIGTPAPPVAGDWTRTGDDYSLSVSTGPGRPAMTGLCWGASAGKVIYGICDDVGGGNRSTFKAIDTLEGNALDPALPANANRENEFIVLTNSDFSPRPAPFAGGYTNGNVVAVGGLVDANQNGLVETLADATDAEGVSTTGDAWVTGPAYPGIPWQQMGATSEAGTLFCAGGTGRKSPNASGGGAYSEGILSVSGCTFDYNLAAPLLNIAVFGKGGGLFSTAGELTIDGESIFRNNIAHQQSAPTDALGGAVCSELDLKVEIKNTRFEENETQSYNMTIAPSLTEGGAVYFNGSESVLIDGSTFLSNTADHLGFGSAVGYGGGLSSNSVKALTVKNSTFTLNEVLNPGTRPFNYSFGGGLFIFPGGESNVTSCTFTSNRTGDYGGGACSMVTGAQVNYSGSTFDSNIAFDDLSFGAGGGTANITPPPIIIITTTAVKQTSCSYINNYSFVTGGGIAGGQPENCLLKGNNSGGSGGGSTVVIATRSLYDGNVATSIGGGSDLGDYYECEFKNNIADTGGAISGSTLAVNTLIYDNTAFTNGGAAYVEGSGVIMDLIHCTLSENYAEAAGGIYAFTNVNSPEPALLRLRNTIVWDNKSAFFPSETFSSLNELITDDADVDILYSCVRGRINGGISDGTGNIGLSADDNPQFISPADGNFRLNTTSPCINTGTNDEAVVGLAVTIDFDGNARPNQLVADMGAYESLGNRPEIVVKGNDVEIVSGDLTPDVVDGTEFGFQDPNGHSNTTLTSNVIPYPNTAGLAVSATPTTIEFQSNASSIDDIYNGYTVGIISGTATGETALITDYDGVTRTATVAWNPLNVPDTTSAYSVFLAPDKIQLASNALTVDDVYNDDVILILTGGGAGNSRIITDYDGTTRIATVDANWSTPLSASTKYQISTTLMVAAGNTITLTSSASDMDDEYNGLYINVVDMRDANSGDVVAATASSVTLATSASIDPSYYVGCRVQITSGTGAGQERVVSAYSAARVATLENDWATIPDTSSTYSIEPLDDQVRLITDYDGTTKVATVDEDFIYVHIATYQIYAGHWFSVENIGITDLILTNTAPNYVLLSQDGQLAVDFTVLVQPDWVIGSGEDTPFLIGYYPTVGGEEIRTAQVLIANNDSNESLYLFTVGGNAVDPEPEIDIRGVDGTTIADGEISTDAIVGTDFGEINWRTGDLTRVFEIHNIGGSDLHLAGDVTSYDSIRVTPIAGGNSDFTVLTQPTNALTQEYPIAPGSSYSLEIYFDPSGIGQSKAIIEVLSDDTDEASYTFTVSGTGVGPQIKVISQSQELLNLNDLDLDGVPPDDTPDTPSVENFTDFGIVDTNVTSITNLFELVNSGTQTLLLENTPLVEIREVADPNAWPVDDAVIAALPISDDFIVVDQPAQGIPPQLGTTFSIQYSPGNGVAESHYAIVRIISNDTTFIFRVRGSNSLGNLPPDAVITTDESPNINTGLYVIVPPRTVAGLNPVNVYGSFSTDPENDTLEYAWTQIEGLSLNIGNPYIADTTIDFPLGTPPGRYTFRLTVTDGIGGSPSALTDSAEISFYVGEFPVIYLPSVIWENDGVITGTVTDPSGNPIVGAVVTETAGDVLNRLTVSSPTDAFGNFTITVANDSVSNTPDPDSVTIEVNSSGLIDSVTIPVYDDESPVIVIYGNSNEIENGQTVASAADFTYYGTVVPGGSSSQRQYVIANESPSSTLTLTQVPAFSGNYIGISGANAADFTVEYQPAGTVLPDGTNTFAITFNPLGNTLGVREAVVTILSNDDDKSPYTFVVKGNRGQSAEIDVQYELNGISIPHQSSTPSSGNGTLFPTMAVGNTPVTRTFTIANQGELLLNLTGNPLIFLTGEHEADFSVDVTGTSTSLGNQATTTFTLSFSPNDQGERNAIVWIPNSDTDEDPYWFAVRGNGFGIATDPPEIRVLGNNIEITSGDPAIVANGTDFGTVEVADTVSKQFTIENIGVDSQLELDLLTSDEAIFTITQQPADFTLDNGESTLFTISVTPISTQGVTGRITIPNNDPDESPFILVLDVNGGSDEKDYSAGDGGGGGSCSIGLGTSGTGLIPVLLVLLGMIGTRLNLKRKQ